MNRVFVDTNVLFPFSIMDLMLSLAEDFVHDMIWTERLLAEWERVIVREQQRSPVSAGAVTVAIREFFHDSRISEFDYLDLVDSMPGKDEDDRYHMAAAVAGGAKTIVTWNLADFPAEPLARLGITVVQPDPYLLGLLKEWPDEVMAIIVRLAESKRRPPRTTHQMIDSLAKAGVAGFAASLRDRMAAD